MSAPTTTALVPTGPEQVGPLATHPYRVTKLTQRAHDVVTIRVDASDAPMTIAPGQFLMVYMPGIGEAPISVSSNPAFPDVIEITVRDVGWVTGALAATRPGDIVCLRGPYGTPWPLEAATGRDLIIVAGGIGLAPVRPAILAALDRNDKFTSLRLAYGARTPADRVFIGDLERWDADDRMDVAVTVDRAERGWIGPVGLVTKLVDRAHFDPETAMVFTCGPEIMMRFVARSAIERGVSPDRVFVTLERNMRCAVGTCGHCQLGPLLICRDGPVLPWSRAGHLMEVKEL